MKQNLVSPLYGTSAIIREHHKGYNGKADGPKAMRLQDAKAIPIDVPKPSSPHYAEYTNTKMPFGKHKGKWMSELPTDYIKWGIQKLDPYMATMFAVELQRRDKKFR